MAAWQALGPTLAAILLEALRAPLADADAEIAPRAEIIGGPRKGPTLIPRANFTQRQTVYSAANSLLSGKLFTQRQTRVTYK